MRALVPAVFVIVVAIWEIVATVRAPAGVPDDAAWARAAAAVRADHQVGDLVVFAPGWVDPVGRLHLGDLIPVDMAARLDADRYARIWELSIRGARAADTRGLRPAWAQTFGGVTVRRFERDPAVLVTDLTALRPKVTGARAGGPSLEIAEVGFTPRRCLQVEPQPDQSVTLDFGTVTLGGTLVGGVGLADVFTRRDVRDPGRLEVKVDGATVAEVTVGVDDGWRRFTAATTPGEHRVEVVATAVGPRARKRLICVALEARR